MDEIGFVIKSLLASIFVVFVLQMKIGKEQQSLESIAVGYMHKTPATKWMKDMGGGAVRATASAYKNTVGDVIKQQAATINKITDVKAQMKATEDLLKKREQDLHDIENR